MGVQIQDEHDPDFVVIARTDTLRFEGIDEAVKRINMCAEVSADMELPMNDDDAERAPKVRYRWSMCKAAAIARPTDLLHEAAARWAGHIDAQLYLLVSLHFARKPCRK